VTSATEETTRTRSARRDEAKRGRRKRSGCSASKSRTGTAATRRRRKPRETTGTEKEHTSITMVRAALGIEEKKTAGVDSSILRE
jgi:hypothetical protein